MFTLLLVSKFKRFFFLISHVHVINFKGSVILHIRIKTLYPIRQSHLYFRVFENKRTLLLFQAQAAITALQLVSNSMDDLRLLKMLSRKVNSILTISPYFTVQSDPISPYKIFNIKNCENRLMVEQTICDICKENGIILLHTSQGLVMHLNTMLCYQDSKLFNLFSVLDLAAERALEIYKESAKSVF